MSNGCAGLFGWFARCKIPAFLSFFDNWASNRTISHHLPQILICRVQRVLHPPVKEKELLVREDCFYIPRTLDENFDFSYVFLLFGLHSTSVFGS